MKPPNPYQIIDTGHLKRVVFIHDRPMKVRYRASRIWIGVMAFRIHVDLISKQPHTLYGQTNEGRNYDPERWNKSNIFQP